MCYKTEDDFHFFKSISKIDIKLKYYRMGIFEIQNYAYTKTLSNCNCIYLKYFSFYKKNFQNSSIIIYKYNTLRNTIYRIILKPCRKCQKKKLK